MPSYTQAVQAVNPIYLQTRTYSAKDDRKPYGDILSAGVVGVNDFLVTLTAGMGISVAAGIAYISGQNVADQGMYRQYMAASQALTVTGADASNPRLDQVILRIMDGDSDTSGAYEGRIEIVPGTPTAGATLGNRNGAANLATLLENSKNVLLLADILVPAAAASLVGGNLSDRRVRGTLGGNIVGAIFGTTTTEVKVGPYGPAGQAGIRLGGDVYIYREASDVLAIDSQLHITDVAGIKFSDNSVQTTAGGGSSGTVVLTGATVYEVGISGQKRAGRVLALTDFTTVLGLNAPTALYNLGSTSDISGNTRNLTNKGTVTFTTGITGTATEAANFAGSTGQALYVADVGAGDPFRIQYGSWGCWFKTAKRSTGQILMSKMDNASTSLGWILGLSGNSLYAQVSLNGTSWSTAVGNTDDVCDGKWHHVVVTYDGYVTLTMVVDGIVTSVINTSGGFIAGVAQPFNIGGGGAGAATNAQQPFFGQIDEAFVTADILSEDQVRLLYAAKTAHGATTPTRADLNVHRLKRGGSYVVGDFSTSPLRLHNFTAGALTDAGTNGTALTNNGTALAVAGVDGLVGNAFNLNGSTQYLSATDTGLPSGTSARSLGAWFKTLIASGTGIILTYGTTVAGQKIELNIDGTTGTVNAHDGTSGLTSNIAGYNDGRWHYAILVMDNAAVDGLKRKIYVDGKLVASDTTFNSTTLGGANAFRIGANTAGAAFLNGQVDGAFVANYAMTSEETMKLYAKGSQDMGASPKSAGSHIERLDATNVYYIFDTIDSQNTVDLKVA